MVQDSSNRNDLGRYLAMSQVGLELAAPIGVGLVLDRSFGWAPWGVLGGAILGLVIGLTHLMRLANQEDKANKHPSPPTPLPTAARGASDPSPTRGEGSEAENKQEAP